MTRRSRRMLLLLIALGAGAVLIVLSTTRDEAPPLRQEHGSTSPAPVPLPSDEDVAALAARLEVRHPELEGAALPHLCWWFDRLAESLAQAEERLSAKARSPSDAEGSALVMGLRELGPLGLPALVAALTHRSGPEGPDVAAEASDALATLPPTESVRLLAFYERAEDPRLRRGIVAATAAMRPATGAVLQLLEQAAGDEQPWVQAEAFHGLGALGNEAAGALPAIRRHLDSDLEATRLPAATAVLRIAGPDEAAHAVLRAHLASIDPYDRAETIALIVELGEPGREVWPDLIPLLSDDRRTALVTPERSVAPDRVSWAASEALVRLEARGLAKQLRGVVVGNDPRARIGAALALLGLGIQFPAAPKVLVEALELEEDSNWLELKRLEVIQGVLEPEYADDVLLDALIERLHGLHGKASAIALLSLGDSGRERIRGILATSGKGRAYERHSVLLAFLEDPERARGFEAELRQIAEHDWNSWNRTTARDLLDR